jgi:hypothetical protein
MHNYVNLLISIAHPNFGVVSRYAVGIDTEDPLYKRIDIDRWAEPEMRNQMLSLLCEDWLSDGCCIVGCEEIAGAVQWQRVHA